MPKLKTPTTMSGAMDNAQKWLELKGIAVFRDPQGGNLPSSCLMLQQSLGGNHYFAGQGGLYLCIITERTIEIWKQDTAAVLGHAAGTCTFHGLHALYRNAQHLPHMIEALQDEWDINPHDDSEGPF